MSYTYSVLKVVQDERHHRVLVVEPNRSIQATGGLVSYDPMAGEREEQRAMLLQQISAHEKVGAVVFRMTSADGQCTWRLHASQEDDLPKVAQSVLLELLPTWRACLELGVYAVVFTALGEQGPILRDAAATLRDRLADHTSEADQKDRWILGRLVHFLGTTHERAMQAQVPATLSVMRHHSARAMDRMHGEAPPERRLRLDPPITREPEHVSRPRHSSSSSSSGSEPETSAAAY